MKNRIILGHVLAVITMIIWSGTFVSSKILLAYLDPIELLLFRFIIAYFVLLIIYPKFHKITSWKEELLFLGLGLTGVSLYFLAENMALNYTLACNVGLLVSSVPLFTALLAYLFTKDEKFHTNHLFGFAFAMIGTALVIFNGSNFFTFDLIGDILALLSSFIWGIYSILIKKLNHKYSYIYATRKMFSYGILTAAPFLFFNHGYIHVQNLAKPEVIINLLFLGVLASSLCYAVWEFCIDTLGVINATDYTYLMPFINLLLAYIIIGERITTFALIGGVLIILGVYIADSKIKKTIRPRKRNKLAPIDELT